MDEDLIERVASDMYECLNAMKTDEIRHEVVSLPADRHRLIVNGAEGPWVSKYSIAHNGHYSASHPYYAAEMPRVFFAITIHEHKKLRQPSGDTSLGSPRDPAVPRPDPGAEEGVEPSPSPTGRAGGGEDPRFDDDELAGGCWRCGGLKGTHKQACPRWKGTTR